MKNLILWIRIISLIKNYMFKDRKFIKILQDLQTFIPCVKKGIFFSHLTADRFDQFADMCSAGRGGMRGRSHHCDFLLN
jgi:hypothetical protein